MFSVLEVGYAVYCMCECLFVLWVICVNVIFCCSLYMRDCCVVCCVFCVKVGFSLCVLCVNVGFSCVSCVRVGFSSV